MFLSSLPAQNSQFSVVLDSISSHMFCGIMFSHDNIIYAIFCIITSLLFVDLTALSLSDTDAAESISSALLWIPPSSSTHIISSVDGSEAFSCFVANMFVLCCCTDVPWCTEMAHLHVVLCTNSETLLLLCSAGYFLLYFPLKVWQAVLLFLITEELGHWFQWWSQHDRPFFAAPLLHPTAVGACSEACEHNYCATAMPSDEPRNRRLW